MFVFVCDDGDTGGEQANSYGELAGATARQRHRQCRLQLPRRERSQTRTNERLAICLRTRAWSVPLVFSLRSLQRAPRTCGPEAGSSLSPIEMMRYT